MLVFLWIVYISLFHVNYLSGIVSLQQTDTIRKMVSLIRVIHKLRRSLFIFLGWARIHTSICLTDQHISVRIAFLFIMVAFLYLLFGPRCYALGILRVTLSHLCAFVLCFQNCHSNILMLQNNCLIHEVLSKWFVCAVIEIHFYFHDCV